MIRTERYREVGATRLPPQILLAQDRRDQRNHIRVTTQMLGLVKAAADPGRLAMDVAQVEEMHAVAEALHHARQVIVGPGAK